MCSPVRFVRASFPSELRIGRLLPTDAKDVVQKRGHRCPLDGSGNVLRRYVPGPLTDERIIVAEGSSLTAPTHTYFHVNHQGSVMEMTDAAGNAGTTGACAAGVNCIRLAYDLERLVPPIRFDSHSRLPEPNFSQ
jgi:hypothetical protein